MASSVWVEPEYVTPIRFVAEYYTSEYLTLEERVDEVGQRFDLKPLGSLGRLFAGPFGSTLPTSVFVDDGIPLLRVQNVGELEILTDNLAHIGRDTHQKIIRSRLVSGDLAIAKAGRIGTTAIIPSSIPECNVTQHVVGVQVSKRVDNDYLAAFLASKYGRFQFERQGVGTLLKYLGVEDTRQVKVVLPPRPVQEYIGAEVRLAERCRTRVRELAELVRSKFYEVLGQPLIPSGSKSSFVESSKATTQRLDSKFYQPDYLHVDRLVREYPNGCQILGDLVVAVSNGVEYRDFVDEGRPYLTVGNIQRGYLDLDNAPRIPWAVKVSKRGKIKSNDVLVVRTGSIGQAAFVRDLDVEAIISSHFIRLRLHQPERAPWIAFFLGSWIGQLLQERISYGAVQPQIGQDLLLSLPIPSLENGVIDTISSHLLEQYSLRDQSLQFIREAKADVEALIEGRLDVEGIVAGRVQPPTWEEIKE